MSLPVNLHLVSISTEPSYFHTSQLLKMCSGQKLKHTLDTQKCDIQQLIKLSVLTGVHSGLRKDSDAKKCVFVIPE